MEKGYKIEDGHRGPSKEGKKPLTIQVSVTEWKALGRMADDDMRSRVQQARFLVREGVRVYMASEVVESVCAIEAVIEAADTPELKALAEKARDSLIETRTKGV